MVTQFMLDLQAAKKDSTGMSTLNGSQIDPDVLEGVLGALDEPCPLDEDIHMLPDGVVSRGGRPPSPVPGEAGCDGYPEVGDDGDRISVRRN